MKKLLLLVVAVSALQFTPTMPAQAASKWVCPSVPTSYPKYKAGQDTYLASLPDKPFSQISFFIWSKATLQASTELRRHCTAVWERKEQARPDGCFYEWVDWGQLAADMPDAALSKDRSIFNAALAKARAEATGVLNSAAEHCRSLGVIR